MRSVLVSVLLLFFVASPAWADEPTLSLMDRLKGAEKATEPSEWVNLLKLVPVAYPVADGKTRKALMKRMGKALKSDHKDIAPTALRAILRIGDSEVAWSEALCHVVPDRKKAQISPYDMEIFGALYTLRPDGAIDTLLTLVRKAKNPDIAAWSMRALGGYERSTRRVYILDKLGQTLLANVPGRRKGYTASPRWKAMVVFVAQTLNNLTGQTARLDEWGTLWMKNRKHLEVLFVRPLPK